MQTTKVLTHKEKERIVEEMLQDGQETKWVCVCSEDLDRRCNYCATKAEIKLKLGFK